MSFRKALSGVTLGTVVCSLFVFGGGCLTRPVALGQPVTKTNFTTTYSTNTINKIDILFDVDNSASMGDKQQYLESAVPDLINRLVTPNCVDANGNALYASSGAAVASEPDGSCPADANGVVGQPEFVAIKDMHIGVISSSLGTRGANGSGGPNDQATCPDSAAEDQSVNAEPLDYLQYLQGAGNQPNTSGQSIPKHNDDQAHLLNRTATPGSENAPTSTSSATTPSNYLAWYPAAPTDNGDNTVQAASDLTTDFQDLVIGAQDFGCGIESQLESWYRFLVQPDPYASIAVSNGAAQWQNVDATIIQQRHDFLRPDSLVVIVDLTDENDSEIDVRALGGKGYIFLDGTWQPPHGTTECASNPADPNCMSCDQSTAPASDANCVAGPYPEDDTNWAFFNNTRHIHMKQRYGVDVQFPIQRYVLGLTSAKVPDRNGEYPTQGSSYQGLNNLNCVNPLYAASLPQASDLAKDSSGNVELNSQNEATLCNLTPNSTRQPSSTNPLVYYAHIGGVPHELLTTTDSSGNVTVKENLSTADWTAILGQDPLNYNYQGIDPHMIESYQPRGNGINVASATSAPNGDEADDWYTDGESAPNDAFHVNLPVDREYACVFKLSTPRDCNPATALPTDYSSCDCSSAGLAADHVPTVCNPDQTNHPFEQDYAKAYPTIRELLLAKLVGQAGIVSSLCPIVLDNTNDPLYGYRPAITAIIDRLKNALQPACLPQKLVADDDAGDVPCLVLVTLAGEQPTSNPDESICSNNSMYPSLEPVDPTVLQNFQSDQRAAAASGAADLSQFPTCEVKQILPSQFGGASSCKGLGGGPSSPSGWCYVEDQGNCPQSLVFTSNALPPGAQTSLQCLEASSTYATTSGGSATTTTGSDASSNSSTTSTGSDASAGGDASM